MQSRVWASIGVVVGVLGLGTLGAEWGCSTILGLDAKTLGDLDSGNAGGDSGGSDASAGDAGGGDGGPGAGACPEDGSVLPGYHDVTSPTCWTTFDLMIVDPNAQGFSGATFDGKYVYLVPNSMGGVARLDTTADFTSGLAWSTYSPPGSTQETFNGAVFDGRYLYLVPASMGSLATRYDTKAPFSAAASWTTFDTSKLNANATDFAGGTFDGRYVYMAPSELSNAGGLVVRYDSTQPFGTMASWSTFDTTALNGTISGFWGGIFDGRYVYLIPDGSADLGVSARYDTHAPFAAASSWVSFSFISVDKNAYGFQGGAFDGSFLYFAPASNGNGAPGGTALRYGTGGGYTAASSWTPFPPAELVPAATAYTGATFDGRYIYFAPTGSGGGEDNDFLLQYDTTTGAFASKSSWRSFATTSINSNALDFAGAVFDGRFVYLVPQGSVVARFDARAPGPLPTLGDSGVPFYGSFF